MPALQQLPAAGAVVDTWRALLTGPWRREMPLRLRHSRFLVVLYVASGLADTNGRIPDAPDAGTLTARLARSCGTRPGDRRPHPRRGREGRRPHRARPGPLRPHHNRRPRLDGRPRPPRPGIDP